MKTNPKILHKQFIQLGMQRHKLMNELLAILPEIFESKIYKKYASSIFEYASKFGGISKSAVEKRLRLEKHLQDKPALKAAIKHVGVNKVSMIATIATPNTDRAFADRLKNMSKTAIATLSKELRKKSEQSIPLESPSPCEAQAERVKLELDEEMSFLFLKLKKKFGENLSNKQVMRMILEKVAEDDKKKIVTGDDSQCHSCEGRNLGTITGDGKKIPACAGMTKGASRYIPIFRKRKALNETNHKCAYPYCNKPAEVFHHTKRFSTTKSHDSVRPLCKSHHEFAHNGLIQNETSAPNNWQINLFTTPRENADYLYRKYRRKNI